MKRVVLLGGVLLAALIFGLALNGSLGGITGNVSSASPVFDMQKSIQVGVVLLASLGILVITLVNVVHKD